MGQTVQCCSALGQRRAIRRSRLRQPEWSPVKLLIRLAVLPLIVALGGCDWVVMNPSGDIAAQQRDLIVISTILMLLIIIPVIALTVLFAWRYRSSNKDAVYDADWHHSTSLEVVIWAAPLVIIIALGAVTWVSTHLLDPYRPLARLDSNRPIPADVKPITVQAVALDWKWLFFYPELGIATVNELAAPVDAPINFKLTSSSVMNSFFVPALAGQIYAMPGMETKLHAVINHTGEYEGFSANYSGAGFSDMRFKFKGLSREDFDKWVAEVKASADRLDRAVYTELEKPSLKVAPRRYGGVEDGLYDAVLNRCVDPNKMCVKDMMRADSAGGGGLDGVRNVHFARPGDKDSRFVAAICTPAAPAAGGEGPASGASVSAEIFATPIALARREGAAERGVSVTVTE